MTDLSKLTDLDLVKLYKENGADKQNASLVLFQRYYPLVCKMRIKLNNVYKSYSLTLDDEDYNTDAWEAFIKSMESIDITKIYREDYGHYIRFLGYLKALNRDLFKHTLKQLKNTIPIDYYMQDNDDKSVNILDLQIAKDMPSTEEEYFINISTKVIRQSIKNIKPNLSSNQIVILSGLETGIKKTQVCKDLNITMYQYTKELTNIQKILKKEMSLVEQKLS